MSYLQASTLGLTQYKSHLDTTSHIRAAGASSKDELSVTTKDSLNWLERPATPEDIKRWRQSTLHEPGKVTRHPGLSQVTLPPGPYGIKSKEGESAAHTMKQVPESAVAQWSLARKEEIYASSVREPLGAGYVRGFKLPEGAGTTRPFGVVYGSKELERTGQIKEVMTVTSAEEDASSHHLYVKSHASYLPGEQRHRNYDWTSSGVDPAEHRFGALDKQTGYRDGVKKALQPGLDETMVQEAKIVSRIYEDHKASSADILGKGRKLGSCPPLPADHSFGSSSVKKGSTAEPGVDQLIQGSYTEEQQQPDADLGKSLREGWRNVAPPERVFGVPSVRTDIPLPSSKSVANTRNYGNEPDAMQLLRPPKSVERGVYAEDYLKLLSVEDMKGLVAEAGVNIQEEEFGSIFNMASEADGSEGQACLDTFFRARKAYLNQNLKITLPF